MLVIRLIHLKDMPSYETVLNSLNIKIMKLVINQKNIIGTR